MRAIDADELKKCVLKWLPQDPCGKEEKEMPFETDICVSMLMEIDEQPTIQPEIVRCKDCKHWKDSDGVFRRGTGAESKCPLNLHQVYEGTFFCGLAERREVTNDHK